jgi:heptosyltransferase-3
MPAILFIAPADLGETVLATGALDHALIAGGDVTVVCGTDAADLFRAVPGVKRITYVGNNAGALTWGKLWLDMLGARFDVAIDARGVVLGAIAPATTRVALKLGAVVKHRVDEWTEAMSAPRALAPRLWIDEAARNAASAIAGDAEKLLVLAPGGAWGGKRWAPERFAAVARRLAGNALSGARIIVMGAAARDAELTRSIRVSLEADGVDAVDAGAGLDLLAAAALVERATLVIGNDNVLTHIAAAAGAPTLTLFGPTDERVRAPYGPRTRTLRGKSFEEIAASPALDGGAGMEDVSIDAVEAAASDVLHAGGLR